MQPLAKIVVELMPDGSLNVNGNGNAGLMFSLLDLAKGVIQQQVLQAAQQAAAIQVAPASLRIPNLKL